MVKGTLESREYIPVHSVDEGTAALYEPTDHAYVDGVAVRARMLPICSNLGCFQCFQENQC